MYMTLGQSPWKNRIPMKVHNTPAPKRNDKFEKVREEKTELSQKMFMTKIDVENMVRALDNKVSTNLKTQ